MEMSRQAGSRDDGEGKDSETTGGTTAPDANHVLPELALWQEGTRRLAASTERKRHRLIAVFLSYPGTTL